MRVSQFRLVKCLGADAVRRGFEHTVAGVYASAHNEIANYGIFAVGTFAEHNAAPGICIFG